jgi:hypothetical protein
MTGMLSGSIKVVAVGFAVGYLGVKLMEQKKYSISTMNTVALIAEYCVQTATLDLWEGLRTIHGLSSLPTISETHRLPRRSDVK